jgi:hypothetical protein
MTTAVTFEITVKDNTSIHVIANKLNHFDLTVLPYTIEQVGEKAFDPNHIMCTSLFSDGGS